MYICLFFVFYVSANKRPLLKRFSRLEGNGKVHDNTAYNSRPMSVCILLCLSPVILLCLYLLIFVLIWVTSLDEHLLFCQWPVTVFL